MSWRKHRQPHERRRKVVTDNSKSRSELDTYIQAMHPKYIIGIDEVGWGAIAGPLVLGCVVYETSYRNAKLKDSKKYTTDKARQKAYDIVKATAIYSDLNIVTPGELEVFGAGACIQSSMLTLAMNAVKLYPESIVVLDGKHEIKALKHPQICVPKADSVCVSVSAASILAKVYRDTEMCKLHPWFVEFDWYANKGYPTPQHIKLLGIHGVTEHHRLNVQLVVDVKNKIGMYKENSSEAEEIGRDQAWDTCVRVPAGS